MLNPNGGAIANIGSTREDFPVTGGNYQCSGGLNTGVEIDSVRLLDNEVEAHWRANIGGVSSCTETGRLAGVKQ